jgi:predicted nucleic acid-binding protein
VVVAVIAIEDTSRAIDRVLAGATGSLLVSDFCVAETSAAIARLGRTGAKSPDEVSRMFQDLDEWVSDLADSRFIEPEDVAAATDFVRQPGVSLRAPDAIHIAAAHRLGATLLTLDNGMARAAAALSVPYINPAEAEAPGALKD